MITTPGFFKDGQLDYALVKVLFGLCKFEKREQAKVHLLHELEKKVTLSTKEVIFVVAHGNNEGKTWGGLSNKTEVSFYPMTLATKFNRVINEDWCNEIRLLACMHGSTGFKKPDISRPVCQLAIGLQKKGITVKGANGYTFGAESTLSAGYNQVMKPGFYDSLDKLGAGDLPTLEKNPDLKRFYEGNGSIFENYQEMFKFVELKVKNETALKNRLSQVPHDDDFTKVFGYLQENGWEEQMKTQMAHYNTKQDVMFHTPAKQETANILPAGYVSVISPGAITLDAELNRAHFHIRQTPYHLDKPQITVETSN